ncbi:MAG TPA: tetratricopeptide repeat protein, partial [Gemmatimonadales bacterium]|nr:tetratricopeptide repeat protein [Gemmatimonadales bacterium]
MTDGVFPDRLTQLRARWESDPASRIFLQLAEEYRHLGRVQDALAVLDKGLQEHPGYLSALVAKGRCHLELADGESARVVLERVVKQDATQMVANKLLVRAYLETGDPVKARERLDLYSLLNDSDPEIEDLRRRIRQLERPAAPQRSSMDADP